MKAMIEILESRTLLSAAPVAASFSGMQTEMSVVLPAIVYTSPLGRYTGTPTSSQGKDSAGFTFIVQQWNTTAGTMQFKVINPDGTVEKGTGTISGAAHRQFTFQCHSGTTKTRIVTLTGKMARNYASAAGTYVDRTLTGVLHDSGTFSLTR